MGRWLRALHVGSALVRAHVLPTHVREAPRRSELGREGTRLVFLGPRGFDPYGDGPGQ